MEPLDLTNMDKESAREYVFALLTTVKKTKMKKTELEKEVTLWKNRVKLAAEKKRSDLQAQAMVKLDEKKEELFHINAEERELMRELQSAKSQLQMIQNRPELSINADQLLIELEMVVGERDETADKFREFQAEQELEDLKRKMDSEQ